MIIMSCTCCHNKISLVKAKAFFSARSSLHTYVFVFTTAEKFARSVLFVFPPF